jgi:hypothetical protein
VSLLDEPVTTLCGHNFCRECILKWMASAAANKSKCPNCHAKLQPADKLVINTGVVAAIAANNGALFSSIA